MENLISARNLTMTYAGETLYDEVSFGVDSGQRIAVVGPNGCGKSTLFKLIAGEINPVGGEVVRRTGTTLSYMAQEEFFGPGDTPREIVARALAPLRQAIDDYQEATEKLAGQSDPSNHLLERQSHLLERIQKLGGWSWEHRVEEMVDRLEITPWIDEPMGGLSGGQRRRVDLARVLLEASDVLLLDEPTNHLDTTAAEWLQNWLLSEVSTLLFVTHDRYFLEHVADRILEIDADGIYDYPGNYQTFMERKAHRTEVRRRTEARRKKHLEKELKWLSGGVKSQQNRSRYRVEEIEALKEADPIYVERDVEMELAEPGEFDDVILAAGGLWKSRGDHSLLEHAHLALRPGDRLGIIGPNGCGKSTLLEVLVGRERYDAGRVEQGKRTEIAYLEQHAPTVDPDATVFDALGQSDYVWIGSTRYHKQDYLRKYLFDRHLQKSRVGALSGGQKRRFAIAQTFAKNPNLLILDEPTNDLDILSLQALEESLRGFEGCVITVSHDRYFLNRVCTSIIAFEGKKLVRYEGNYDDYRRQREEASEEVSQSAPAQQTSSGPGDSRPTKEAKKAKVSQRRSRQGLSYREKERLKEVEAAIESAEALQLKIEGRLADPALYREQPDEIEPLNRELSQVQSRLKELIKEWESLEELR